MSKFFITQAYKIRTHLILRRYLLTKRFKVYAFQFKGKKYLTIMETGWRGEKWKRQFEIAHELDAQWNIIPFDGGEADRFTHDAVGVVDAQGDYFILNVRNLLNKERNDHERDADLQEP